MSHPQRTHYTYTILCTTRESIDQARNTREEHRPVFRRVHRARTCPTASSIARVRAEVDSRGAPVAQTNAVGTVWIGEMPKRGIAAQGGVPWLLISLMGVTGLDMTVTQQPKQQLLVPSHTTCTVPMRSRSCREAKGARGARSAGRTARCHAGSGRRLNK